jgi:hypothetical protein
LQFLFQTGTKVTNGFSKLGTNWPELIKGKRTDKKGFSKMKEGLPLPKAKQIPFKMKRLVAVDFRKPNVRMKVNVGWPCFGKLRWKFKNGIYNPKTIC